MANTLSYDSSEEDNPFKCTICDKMCGTAVGLSNHVRIHPGPFPYRCSICQSTFQRKRSLQRHMRRQHGKKSVIQSQPNKSIKQIKDRPSKEATEKGPRGPAPPAKSVFPCIECSLVFRDDKILQAHVQGHVKQQIYKCEYCEKYFLDLIQYLEHTDQH